MKKQKSQAAILQVLRSILAKSPAAWSRFSSRQDDSWGFLSRNTQLDGIISISPLPRVLEPQ